MPNQLQQEKREYRDDNIVFVGGKPLMNYVSAVKMLLSKLDKVIIKARGQFINRAVDTEECARKHLISQGVNVKLDSVIISSEEFQSKGGKTINVSVIEIVLIKT